MNLKKRLVCPMGVAGLLDSKFRRSFHNPNRILKPYIRKNMTALDIGCGPGVFSIEMAELMEGAGKVYAVDMQEGMLEIISQKISGKPAEKNIVLHKCSQHSINFREKTDFVLMYYMVHEVPDKKRLFDEVIPLVNKNGLVMIVEPFLISKKEFSETVNYFRERGFAETDKPKIMFSKGTVLKRI